MWYAVVMDSGAMIIYTNYTKLHKEWFSHSTVDGGGGDITDTQTTGHISLFSFFKIGKVG
jgi:hypothetical protein